MYASLLAMDASSFWRFKSPITTPAEPRLAASADVATDVHTYTERAVPCVHSTHLPTTRRRMDEPPPRVRVVHAYVAHAGLTASSPRSAADVHRKRQTPTQTNRGERFVSVPPTSQPAAQSDHWSFVGRRSTPYHRPRRARSQDALPSHGLNPAAC